jgi:cytochrome c oxidase cbb3-type subunit 2
VAWRAAWLFSIAGWLGSANGIGMAETLQRVPVAFIVASGAVILTILGLRSGRGWRIPMVAVVVAMPVLVFPKQESVRGASADDAARGREVYLSEGCIHCHSQYPRPGSADEEMWGTAGGNGEGFSGRPVLIGNRRQGPDLRNIGARRSPAWLRIHFLDPRALSPDSAMPSYRHLFDDRRGEDLIAYLRTAGVDGIGARMERAASWQPSPEASDADGAALFSRHCATCHGADGKGGGFTGRLLARPPANLTAGPFIWTGGSFAEDSLKAARVIKFGIPGTDMPGHESLTDAQVKALAEETMKLRSFRGDDAP